jgi:hypothetical protein
MKAFKVTFGLFASYLPFTAALIGDCASGPIGALQAVGGGDPANAPTSIEICETQWAQGHVVSGVEVWATADNVAGIQLTYSNGDVSHLIGTASGEHHEVLTWDTKVDRVKELHLWANPKGDRTGKIYLKVANADGTNERELDVGQNKVSSHMWDVTTYSGIMLGGFGRADSAIVAWGFMFLESEVMDISLTDFNFHTDDLDALMISNT